MTEADPQGSGTPQAPQSPPIPQPPPVWLALSLAVALLAGAVAGAGISLLRESDSTRAPAGAAGLPQFSQDAIAAVVARAMPSVVAIVNEFPAQGEDPGGTAGGAGVIIDSRGFILTNAHIVQIPGTLFVLLSSGEVHNATVVSHDAPFTDIAVVRIQAQGLQPLPVADSSTLAVGQTVVAIGSPDIDYFNSVSTGVVSGLERRKQLGNVWLEDLIQTDAAINVGNSGGPLLNLNAEIVGINTFRDIGGGDPLFGISFAISSRTFGPIVQSMINSGRFPRPYFGVEHTYLTPEVAAERGLANNPGRGALIDSVIANSPASAAGVRPGDTVIKFGPIDLTSQFGLLNALALAAPNEKVDVEVLRDGQPVTLSVQLVPR